MEEWLDINDFSNYQISNKGNVKNKNTNKTLKQCDNGKGYLYVKLSNKGRTKKYYVHRLIAEYFIPNPTNLPCVAHIDNNHKNNDISNLEWSTDFFVMK